jgi:hypothetical protein
VVGHTCQCWSLPTPRWQSLPTFCYHLLASALVSISRHRPLSPPLPFKSAPPSLFYPFTFFPAEPGATPAPPFHRCCVAGKPCCTTPHFDSRKPPPHLTLLVPFEQVWESKNPRVHRISSAATDPTPPPVRPTAMRRFSLPSSFYAAPNLAPPLPSTVGRR